MVFQDGFAAAIFSPGERARDPRSFVGREIEGAVIEPERGSSSIVISPLHLARARLRRALERGERLSGRVAAVRESGALVDVEGLRGFVPRTELRRRELARGHDLRGRSWRGYAIEVRARRFVLSSLPPARRRRWARARERWVRRRRAGDEVSGKVVGVRASGVLVRVGPGRLDALVPRRQLSWLPISSVESSFAEGQRLRVKLLQVRMRGDRDEAAVVASLRATQPNPWPAITSSLVPGREVECTVMRCTASGVYVRLAEDPRLESFLPDGALLRSRDELGLAPGARLSAVVKRVDADAGRIYLRRGRAPSVGRARA